MARTSRKNVKQSNTTIKYNAGIYARLSIEDTITGGDSIENQIDMLKNYIDKNENLIYKKIYIDNGFTGTNFNREAFNQLIEDIKKGVINTIVVKDLSRFGRNYIESGHYIEKIFPIIGVRFIAVNDNFDSLNIKENQDLEIALKSIINDSYAKDISKKVCTALDTKKKSGKFLGKYAPYGYKKSVKNKYVLEINEETKDVVKMIFNLRLNGMGVTAIARKLNDLNIPSQYRYLWEKGIRGSKDVEEKALWRGSSVDSLLKNPNYIGAIIERKYDRALYKGKKNNKKKIKNIKLIKNTHEPIIDEETFYKVQSMSKLKSKEKITDNKENILKGLVICGICGGRLQRDRGYKKVNDIKKSYTFYCPRKFIKQGGCRSTGIKEDKLKNIIFKNIQLQIRILLDEKKYKEKNFYSSENKRKLNLLESKRTKLISEKNKIKRLKEDTYKDYKAGLLSASGYEFVTKKYEKVYDVILQQIDQIEADKNNLFDSLKNAAVKKTINFKDETKLTKEMIQSLIQSIVVTKNKVVINYKYKDEYKAFLGV